MISCTHFCVQLTPRRAISFDNFLLVRCSAADEFEFIVSARERREWKETPARVWRDPARELRKNSAKGDGREFLACVCVRVEHDEGRYTHRSHIYARFLDRRARKQLSVNHRVDLTRVRSCSLNSKGALKAVSINGIPQHVRN